MQGGRVRIIRQRKNEFKGGRGMIETHIQGIPCIVDVEYQKAYKGAREKGSGMQLEPDEPEGFEIVGIYKSNGKGKHMQWLEDKMTDEDRNRIHEAALKELQEDQDLFDDFKFDIWREEMV
jgi:hypothetical protein